MFKRKYTCLQTILEPLEKKLRIMLKVKNKDTKITLTLNIFFDFWLDSK